MQSVQITMFSWVVARETQAQKEMAVRKRRRRRQTRRRKSSDRHALPSRPPLGTHSPLTHMCDGEGHFFGLALVVVDRFEEEEGDDNTCHYTIPTPALLVVVSPSLAACKRSSSLVLRSTLLQNGTDRFVV
jgi:hypothetical protein